MFYLCKKLKQAPDVSVLTMDNVTSIDSMFSNCTSMETTPNVSG